MVLQSSSEDETKEDPSVLESSYEDAESFGVMGGTCLTTFQLDLGGNEVTDTYVHLSILHTK